MQQYLRCFQEQKRHKVVKRKPFVDSAFSKHSDFTVIALQRRIQNLAKRIHLRCFSWFCTRFDLIKKSTIDVIISRITILCITCGGMLISSIYRSSRPKVLCKKGVLGNFTKFRGKHLCQSLFFNKETLAQVFSCKFCEISKNNFFTEQLRTAVEPPNYRLVRISCNVAKIYKRCMY